ncbi:hypothetical protein TNCV_336591 [Trichonephila clavipes]|nr:hypothetical protein TNCV_336591 [Trichonephila clavipes]
MIDLWSIRIAPINIGIRASSEMQPTDGDLRCRAPDGDLRRFRCCRFPGEFGRARCRSTGDMCDRCVSGSGDLMSPRSAISDAVARRTETRVENAGAVDILQKVMNVTTTPLM